MVGFIWLIQAWKFTKQMELWLVYKPEHLMWDQIEWNSRRCIGNQGQRRHRFGSLRRCIYLLMLEPLTILPQPPGKESHRLQGKSNQWIVPVRSPLFEREREMTLTLLRTKRKREKGYYVIKQYKVLRQWRVELKGMCKL